MKAMVQKDWTGSLEAGQPEREYKAGDRVEIHSEARMEQLETAGTASRSPASDTEPVTEREPITAQTAPQETTSTPQEPLTRPAKDRPRAAAEVPEVTHRMTGGRR